MVTETEVAEITKPVRELTRRDVEKLPMEEFAQLGAKIASGEWKLAEE
jgi:hypothetical protein